MERVLLSLKKKLFFGLLICYPFFILLSSVNYCRVFLLFYYYYAIMCESCCVIVDIEFTCGDEKECDDLKQALQEKYGLISGFRGKKTAFVRGSGIIISERHVITSAVLFPIAHLQRNPNLGLVHCFVLADDGGIKHSGKLVCVAPFAVKSLRPVSGVAVIELDEKINSGALDIYLPQPLPLSGALVEVRGGGAFGHPVFSKPHFSGVVSGVARKAGVMLLDVRAPPGLEGALVTRVSDGAPVGILLHALLVGEKIYPLSLAASLERLYCIWKPSLAPRSYVSDASDEGRKVYIETCAKTVFLCSERAWATGIIVSQKRHVVTCAHFLRASAGSPIRMALACTGASLGTARVLCKPPPSVPWDAVVLGCSRSMESSDFYDISSPEWSPPPLGTTAYVIGYHLIQPQASAESIGPLCLRGTLAKIITVGGHHVMYMVSAPSFFGASGGPVVCSGGRLLGICVSNIEGSGQTPSVCLVLPVPILRCLNSFAKDFTPEQQRQIRALWRVELNFELPKTSEKREKLITTLTEPKL